GWTRTANLSTRADYGTGISLWMSCEYPVDSVVLSGVSGIVLSGVGLSCYQACQMAARPRQYWVCASLNLSNLTTLTIDKGPPPRWIGSGKKHTRQLEGRNSTQKQPLSAAEKPRGLPAWRVAP